MILDTQPLSTPPETKHPLPSVKTGEGNTLRYTLCAMRKYARRDSAPEAHQPLAKNTCFTLSNGNFTEHDL